MEVHLKRGIALIALGYVAAGIVGRGLEAAGFYRCDCDPECWCRRPGLGVFRWVVPSGRLHRGPWNREGAGA